ncbi:MAG: dephospho-CoA kinase [Burkholderiales bacterium]|nr:dephospho-CoA kinase [Burkholderiales bacterium]
MRRYVVGLTGGIGSGKSTIGDEFARLGVTVVDADAIAHALTAPGGGAIAAIREAFGDAFVTAEGAMDRAAMRERVFRQPQDRSRLEAILHPMVRSESERQVSACASAYCMLMVPLLVEAAGRDPAWRDRFDRILVVDCREETQIERVRRRNGFDEAAVRRIMAAQASRAARLAHADDVIDNDGPREGLAAQVAALHASYLARAARRPA